MKTPIKRVAFYFSSPGSYDYPFHKESYHESYGEVFAAIEKAGIEVVVVRADAYQGGSVFAPYDTWDGKAFTRHEEAIEVGLIFNRDDKNTIPRIEDCPIINPPEMDDICRDKLLASQVLSEVSMPTFATPTFEEAKAILPNLPGEKVVLKPRFGEQAQDVHVIDKADIRPDLYADWGEVITQGFIDSRVGVPGLVQGVHDLSVQVFNGHFVGAKIRQPAPDSGSFISTVASGGSMQVFGFERMPEELWEKVEYIDRQFARFSPRMYRADFGNSPEGFRLIEINSRPGIANRDKEGADYWMFNKAMVEIVTEFFSRV